MSVSTDVDYLDERAEALADLRSIRRRKRIQNLDKFEAFYKAYLTAILGGVGLFIATGWFGNEPVAASTAAEVRADAPLYLGIVVALVVAVGLRSGSRGGPLALELADVRHILLAPVDRRDSVRALALRSMRHGAFVGAVVGAASAFVALRRLPGNDLEWVVGGIAFGAGVVALGYGVALIASGRQLKPWMADVLGLIALGWAVGALLLGLEISPFTWVGAIATAALGFDPFSVVGLLVVVATLGVARVLADGLSVEDAERRSRLIGGLRFAATTQDIRTVMLIQRQLSQQSLRRRPWIRLRPMRRPPSHATVRVSARRTLASLLRWPLMRLLRLVALVASASACVVGVWAGTTALMVPAGLLLWLAAMDLVEPSAQDSDKPDRIVGLPVDRGLVALRGVVPSIATLFVLVCVPAAIFVSVTDGAVATTMLPAIIPMVTCAIGGALLTVIRSPSYSSGGASIMSAEIASLAVMWRVGMPPAVAIIGMLPIAAGHNAWVQTHDTTQVAAALNIPYALALTAATWSLLWIRYSDQLRAAFTPKIEEAKKEAQK